MARCPACYILIFVAEPDGRVALRPPPVVRAYVIVFVIFWVDAVSYETIVRGHGASFVVGPVSMALGLCFGTD